MLSGKFDEEGNKKEKKNQRGKEKRHKTRSFYICCISLTKVGGAPRPGQHLQLGLEGLYGLEKLTPRPLKPIPFPLSFAVIFYLFQQDF